MLRRLGYRVRASALPLTPLLRTSSSSSKLGEFLYRHVGPNEKEQRKMLDTLGLPDASELASLAIPSNIRGKFDESVFGEPKSERDMLEELSELSRMNQVWRSFIGCGYYDTITPEPIKRHVFENAAWYTPYTPYQAEISQGRMESLLNFQTMVCDLTGREVANASMLDESSAAAEAMLLAFRQTGSAKRRKFYVGMHTHPQTIAVLKSRAEPLGIQVVSKSSTEGLTALSETDDIFGVLLQYPHTEGSIYDLEKWVVAAHKAGALVAVATDLLALTLIKPPGEFDADICFGSAQRFGVPLGFGGPHAAFFATRPQYVRQLPGRIVGVTKDAQGNSALRLSLQTREQHIRREKATSNICTAQALLANMAAMYAVYHGPEGLREIARRVHKMAFLLGTLLDRNGQRLQHITYFDTIKVKPQLPIEEIRQRAQEKKINLRYYDDGCVGIAVDETTRLSDIKDLLYLFDISVNLENAITDITSSKLPLEKSPMFRRHSAYLNHSVFNSYHSETELVRYIKRLENKDISLVHSMIPLGSCTMKLNAATEMRACSWREFAGIHPFVPPSQTAGYLKMFDELEKRLCELTGTDRVCFQPNSGAEGEFTGLCTIRSYLKDRGQGHRHVCLIPVSAHGTNPASAALAGMKIVPVHVTRSGEIDLKELKQQVDKNKDSIACIMITYPSTYGFFDSNVREVTDLIHDAGGQVYVDGANLTAQVALCRPGDYGGDVCHLNLHKTFCIPHGGGGPGKGPIAVKKHLVPYLPTHPLIHPYNLADGGVKSMGPVNGAPYGSASIVPISYAFIKMLGVHGLRKATEVAILSANYMSKSLEGYYKTLYRNQNGYVAHEFIIDCNEFKKFGINATDIAKRLQDFGFHAPTTSFPVIDTLMIEPTESESKAELDRLCDALKIIRGEIRMIEEGKWDRHKNPIKLAPHSLSAICSSKWDRPYPRELGAFPAPFVKPESKFWPSVGRVDDVYGDQHLMCTCPSVTEMAEKQKDDGENGEAAAKRAAVVTSR